MNIQAWINVGDLDVENPRKLEVGLSQDEDVDAEIVGKVNQHVRRFIMATGDIKARSNNIGVLATFGKAIGHSESEPSLSVLGEVVGTSQVTSQRDE